MKPREERIEGTELWIERIQGLDSCDSCPRKETVFICGAGAEGSGRTCLHCIRAAAAAVDKFFNGEILI